MQTTKFRGYIKDEWLEHRANLKCFKPITHVEVKTFTSLVAVYYWSSKKKNNYPEGNIKLSLN